MPTYTANVRVPESKNTRPVGIVADSFEDAEATAIDQGLAVESWARDQPSSGLDLVHRQNAELIRLMTSVEGVLERGTVEIDLSRWSIRRIKGLVGFQVLAALIVYTILLVLLTGLFWALVGAAVFGAASVAGGP